MEDDKVKELATSLDTTDESLQTQRNIGLGANFVDVVNQYGENFQKKAFVEEFDSGITYFDRKQKIKLSFYFNHDEKGRRLRYINLEQK